MKPTLADPFVWVGGHKYDLSDPAFIRARCRCGAVADFRVLFMGERGPHYRLDCPACGYRAPAIGPGDVFVLALENVAGFVRDGETVWIEWKKIRSKPGTGVGGRYAPRDIVPPKAPPRKTCRSCADCDQDDGGWWCNELGQYVDPTVPCDGHRPKARGCAGCCGWPNDGPLAAVRRARDIPGRAGRGDGVIDLRNVDCREGFATIPDESVDVIFTDPPYAREYLDCYRILSEEGSRVLKPSGFLATYSGQYHLPEVLRLLDGEVLGWFWMIGQINTLTVMAWPRNVISSWKPILVFQKYPMTKTPGQLGDLVGGKWRLKKHPWEQSIENTIHTLGRLARPGALVLDPFCGTGTNLQAARALSMRAIGFEVDPRTYQMAREKIEQETLAGRAVAEVSP